MRVLLQFPEGLKAQALGHARKLEREGHEVVLSGAPCFGACDLAYEEAIASKADKIIHFGHAEYPLQIKPPIPIEHVEWKDDVDILPVLKLALADERFANAKTVGLLTTVQHLHKLAEVISFLERHGKSVVVGRHGPFSKYDGQILGCDVYSAINVDSKVDCHLYFGGGLFHPDGAAFACSKPVLSCDPHLGKILWLDGLKEKWEKRKKAFLALGIRAKRFGIIVSTKPGQFFLDAARRLKKDLEVLGKEAAIITFNHVSPDALRNFRSFDFYVNTACPRLALDDFRQFDKPVLNLGDAYELVSLLKESRK